MSKAQSWNYVETLLNDDDAIALGFERFSASDIFELNGKTYLWATPVSSTPFDGSYNGCLGYQFSDFAGGKLINDNGRPKPLLQLGGLENTFYGACAYHQAANQAGVIIAEAFPTQTEVFRLFKAQTTSCNQFNNIK